MRLEFYLHPTAWARVLGVPEPVISRWLSARLLQGEATAPGDRERGIAYRLDTLSSCLLLLAKEIAALGFSPRAIESTIPAVRQGLLEVLKPGQENVRLYLGLSEHPATGRAQLFAGNPDLLKIQIRLMRGHRMALFDVTALHERLRDLNVSVRPQALAEDAPKLEELAVTAA